MKSTQEELLSARQSAERLGVKLDTLYAYVSRGLLHSVEVPGSRERRYPAEEIERLRVGRGGGQAVRAAVAEALMPVLDSSICLIEHGRLYYRGRDALALAATATLEDIAALLWQTEGEGGGVAAANSRATARRNPAHRASAVPAGLGVVERCQVRLAGVGAADLAALDLSRAGVVRTGRRIVAELAAALGRGRRSEAPVHIQLATGWRLDVAGADLVRRCLVLLADHEFNASTFVARCVASTGATPYAVVSGALAALSGRRHGGASARSEALFREIGGSGDVMAAMAARLARGEDLPGLGQPLYPDGDPRAVAIIAALGAAVPGASHWIEAAVGAARRLTGKHPNVDFALGAAVTALGLPPGAALGLFVVGRSVGWIAHAMEQYESRVLIRPRARYTGPRP